MEQNNRQDELEIDLKELFLELLTHWKMIILSTVLVAAIAFVYGRFLVTPIYASTSKLYVLTKSTSITSLADIQTGANLTNDYMVVVSGRPVLEQVITNLELEEDYEELYAHVSVNNPTDSRILEITVQDPDPSRAKMITDEIADVAAAYIAEKMDQDPPNLIQSGYTDGKPVSTSTGKYTVIGALIGMLLAMGVVTVTYILNDTILVPEDLEKKLGLNVLGSLPLEEEEDDGERHTRKKKKHETPKKKSA